MSQMGIGDGCAFCWAFATDADANNAAVTTACTTLASVFIGVPPGSLALGAEEFVMPRPFWNDAHASRGGRSGRATLPHAARTTSALVSGSERIPSAFRSRSQEAIDESPQNQQGHRHD